MRVRRGGGGVGVGWVLRAKKWVIYLDGRLHFNCLSLLPSAAIPRCKSSSAFYVAAHYFIQRSQRERKREILSTFPVSGDKSHWSWSIVQF